MQLLYEYVAHMHDTQQTDMNVSCVMWWSATTHMYIQILVHDFCSVNTCLQNAHVSV